MRRRVELCANVRITFTVTERVHGVETLLCVHILVDCGVSGIAHV